MSRSTLKFVFAVCAATLIVGCSSHAITSRHISSDTRAEGAVAGIYYLPEARLHIRLEQADEVASCAVRKDEDGVAAIQSANRTPVAILRRFSVTYVTQQAVPDRDAGYYIDYDESIWSADKLTIDVTKDGLLDKVHYKAEDQTDQVILKIGELAKQVTKAFIPFGQVEHVTTTLRDVSEDCLSFEFKKIDPIAILEWTFDPQNRESLMAINASIEEAIASQSPSQERGLFVIVERGRKLKLAMNPPPLTTSTVVPDKCAGGLCYRPVEPFDFIVFEDNIEVGRKTVLLPAKNRVGQIDVSRTTFVEKVTTIDFEDGALKQVDINKPSEALAVISLPVDIVKAIVAIPAELIQLKIDTTKNNKALVDANKDLITSQRQLLETQQELLKKQRELAAQGKDSLDGSAGGF